MKEPNFNPDDAKLRALLRESRGIPPLPLRFQEGVWRQIEEAEAPGPFASGAGWLDALIARALRPRLALATVAALVLTGAVLGAHESAQAARQDAQARYLAAVAPNSLR